MSKKQNISPVRLDISIGFILLLSVLYLMDTEQLLFLALGAVIIHEAGHIIAIMLCGGRIEGIYIRIFGAKIKLSPYPILSYRKELIIAVSGPVLGLLFAFSASYIARYFQYEVMYTFAGLNLIMSIFNLIPVYPLDGGRILNNIMLLYFCERTANLIIGITSVVFAAATMFLSLLVTCNTGFHLTLWIFTAFIVISVCIESPKIGKY